MATQNGSTGSGRLQRTAGAAAWALGLSLACGAALPAAAEVNPFGVGAPYVYQSQGNDGFDTFTRTLPLGVSTLEVYGVSGNTASGVESTPCQLPAAGDEVCGFSVQITATGNLYLSGFVPASPGGATIMYAPTTFSSSTKVLNLNAVMAENPLPAHQYFHIGSLQVTVTGTGGAVDISGGQMLLPRPTIPMGEESPRRVVPLTLNKLAVPEPGQIWLLVSGVAGLAGLTRLRRARGR